LTHVGQNHVSHAATGSGITSCGQVFQQSASVEQLVAVSVLVVVVV
jgi:hypothetical protein